MAVASHRMLRCPWQAFLLVCACATLTMAGLSHRCLSPPGGQYPRGGLLSYFQEGASIPHCHCLLAEQVTTGGQLSGGAQVLGSPYGLGSRASAQRPGQSLDKSTAAGEGLALKPSNEVRSGIDAVGVRQEVSMLPAPGFTLCSSPCGCRKPCQGRMQADCVSWTQKEAGPYQKQLREWDSCWTVVGRLARAAPLRQSLGG